MQFTSRMWCFLFLFAIGAGLYMGIGDYLIIDNLYGSWKPSEYGLVTWGLIRVHLFGVFLGVIGLVGMLAGVKDYL